MPRALKKRQAEFNVSADTVACAPKGIVPNEPASFRPRSVAGSAADVPVKEEWGGEADLDDLPDEEGEASNKRQRPDSSSGSTEKKVDISRRQPEGASDAAQASKVDPVETKKEPRDDVLEGAPRLAQHIASAAKFPKVAAMAYSLLEAERVTRANSHAFFTVLEAALSAPKRLREKEMRVAYRRLFTAACSREAIFPPELRPTLELWRVRVLVQLELYTDDTFQFSRAVRQVTPCQD